MKVSVFDVVFRQYWVKKTGFFALKTPFFHFLDEIPQNSGTFGFSIGRAQKMTAIGLSWVRIPIRDRQKSRFVSQLNPAVFIPYAQGFTHIFRRVANLLAIQLACVGQLGQQGFVGTGYAK